MLKTLTNQFNVRGFPPAIWAAAGISCVIGIGWSISFTYLSLYLYQERHVSMTSVGLVLLVSGVLSAACQVIGGMTGDRFGHRKMVIAYQLAGLLSSALLAILIGIGAATWLVILSAILVPALGGMSGPPLLAIVADVSDKKSMTGSYSLLAIGGNIAWAIGPLVGGFLLGFTSFAWIFGAGAAIKALALICIPFLPRGAATQRPRVHPLASLGTLVANRKLIAFSLISFLFFLTMSQWAGTLSVFAIDKIGFSTNEYGVLMSISGILIIIFQYPVSHRIGPGFTRKALVLGSLFYAAGFLSLAWVKAFTPAVGSIVIMVIGEMLFIPTGLAVVGQISGPGDTGKSMGFYGLCDTLGNAFGPLMGGLLLDRYPDNPLFLWGPISACSLAAAVGFGLWRGYPRSAGKEAA